MQVILTSAHSKDIDDSASSVQPNKGIAEEKVHLDKAGFPWHWHSFVIVFPCQEDRSFLC